MIIDIEELVCEHLKAQNKEITPESIKAAKQMLFPGLGAAVELIKKHLIRHPESEDLSSNTMKFIANLKFEASRFEHIISLGERDKS